VEDRQPISPSLAASQTLHRGLEEATGQPQLLAAEAQLVGPEETIPTMNVSNSLLWTFLPSQAAIST
jgi:hypothetical protein